MIAQYLPTWYPVASGVLNIYVWLIAVLFLVRPPRRERTLAYAGLVAAAVAILWSASRALWRLRPGGLRPRFVSNLDALSALVPGVLFGVAITFWLIQTMRERKLYEAARRAAKAS